MPFVKKQKVKFHSYIVLAVFAEAHAAFGTDATCNPACFTAAVELCASIVVMSGAEPCA